MERLTEKVLEFVQLKACGNEFCKETCAKYDEEKSCNNCPIQKAFEKLAKYEDLEEQRKLYITYLSLGQEVYLLNSNTIDKYKVMEISIGNKDIIYILNSKNGSCNFFAKDAINKTLFLTQTEAEQALAEMENNREDKNNGQAD